MQQIFERCEKGRKWGSLFLLGRPGSTKIIKWFSLLRHSKGVLAGKPIKLTEWQQFHLCQLYGWRRKEDGFKRFKKSFVEVARKNAKSQEEAGVALYEISVQATKTKKFMSIIRQV